jgi:hypothetical protein
MALHAARHIVVFVIMVSIDLIMRESVQMRINKKSRLMLLTSYDTRDTDGITDEDIGPADHGIPEDCFDGYERAVEEVPGLKESISVEVCTAEEGVCFSRLQAERMARRLNEGEVWKGTISNGYETNN